jgi:phosphoserine phosphatase
MAAGGARCVLVSGGFDFFTGRVAHAAGFHAHWGNRLIDDGEALTGHVAEPILGRDAKLAKLRAEAAGFGAVMADTLAIGDGANDVDMITAAGLGVAYRAKPVLADQADARLDRGDLTALLYFQGYAANQFVTG